VTPAPGPGRPDPGRPDPGRRCAFEYAALRAVPRIDRGEFINVGVVLYCQARDFLAARAGLDENRLRALDPAVDVDAVRAALDGVVAACAGDPAAGPVSGRGVRERFGWVTAPRSTVLQAGPVHGGLTADPAAELDRLMRRLVG
jgi:hypothetical protein